MRTLLVLTLLFFTAFTSNASEKLYNKLNKLYLSDKSKCLELSKKYMHKKKEEAIPYYFASMIYYDKSKESQNLRGVYLQMKRAVSSAVKFEQLSGDQDRDLVHWDEHLASIKNRSEKLIDQLNRNNLQDLSEQLVQNLGNVTSFASHFSPSTQKDFLNEEYLAPIVENVATNFTKVEGQFYGLPKGNEIIASSNSEAEQELLRLINDERKKRFLPMLFWDDNLTAASRYHAYDQGSQAYFSHSSNDLINGKTTMVGGTFDRIRKFYKGSPQGECIAGGNATAMATFLQWMNSKSHAEIILNPSTKFVGIGYVAVKNSPYEHYWVLATGN